MCQPGEPMFYLKSNSSFRRNNGGIPVTKEKLIYQSFATAFVPVDSAANCLPFGSSDDA
jgi:hypothetical protein